MKVILTVVVIVMTYSLLFCGESVPAMRSNQEPVWIKDVIRPGASPEIIDKCIKKATAHDLNYVIDHYDNLNTILRSRILLIAHFGYSRDLESEKFFVREKYRQFLVSLGDQHDHLLDIGDMRYLKDAIQSLAGLQINLDLISYMDWTGALLSLDEADIYRYLFFIDPKQDEQEKQALEKRFTLAARRWSEMWNLAWEIATGNDPYAGITLTPKQVKHIKTCIMQLDSEDQKAVSNAIKELRKIGVVALEFLQIASVKNPSPKVRRIALTMLKQPPLEEVMVARMFVRKYSLDKDILFLEYLANKQGAISQQARLRLKAICPEVEVGSTWTNNAYGKWYFLNHMYMEWSEKKQSWNVNKQAAEFEIPAMLLPYVPWPRQIASDDKKKLEYISSRSRGEKARFLEYASLLYHEDDVYEKLREFMELKAKLSFRTLIRLWMTIPRHTRIHMKGLSSDDRESVLKDARSWLGKQQLSSDERCLYDQAISYGVDYLAWRLVPQSKRASWENLAKTEREKLIAEAEAKLIEQEKPKSEDKPGEKSKQEESSTKTPA